MIVSAYLPYASSQPWARDAACSIGPPWLYGGVVESAQLDTARHQAGIFFLRELLSRVELTVTVLALSAYRLSFVVNLI